MYILQVSGPFFFDTINTSSKNIDNLVLLSHEGLFFQCYCQGKEQILVKRNFCVCVFFLLDILI